MASCPVDHGKASGPAVAPTSAPAKPAVSECPHVAGAAGAEQLNPANAMPDDLKKQLPSPGQRKPLSTERMESSIPRAEGDEDAKWQYPSPQMFYNAMKRKGWKPDEDDMNVIVAIHNAVNEKAWVEVSKIERTLHPECECGPKLVSIRGFSSKLSPKARLYTWLGYAPPFDRHDWVVDRCGQHVRYVIDYYDDKAPTGKLAGLYLDVRPAADSAQAMWDRTRMKLFH